MKANVFKPLIWLTVFVMVVGLACNAVSGSPAQPPAQPTSEPVRLDPTEPPVENNVEQPTEAAVVEQPTEAPVLPSGMVTNLQDVQKATIQIEAQGTFVSPEFGQMVSAGRGSGFIIDPSGIAVTNNHVVTGAALFKVWIGGDTTKTYNARVLGVSECSDLAVIDIDGENFPYLQWYDGGINVGMDMYLAGFPLGEPQFSLSRGIVSKNNADGEASWSSVDSVIEYDANPNPGNSGGPVVTPDGQVMAIHYASNANARQAFGISRDIAKGIVDQLRTGKNIDTIGVNGQAVVTEDGSISGVWVSSVQSGSPADKAGVQGGDLITKIENFPLALDGTMSQYCDILRSHNPGDTLSIEVLRWSQQQILEGQLNGRELAVTFQGEGTTDTGTTDTGTTTGSSNISDGTWNDAAANSGDIWFTTEFEGGMGDWSYWLMNGQDEDFTYTVEDSSLRFELNDENTWVYFTWDPYTFTDVRIDTTAENLGRNTNNVSLICRYSEKGWYEFNVYNSGIYNILYYDNTVKKDYTLLFSGGSNLIRTGKDTNEYTAICNGNELTLGINGVEVKTVEDNNLEEGTTGISVSSFEVLPIIIEFDHFTLSIP